MDSFTFLHIIGKSSFSKATIELIQDQAELKKENLKVVRKINLDETSSDVLQLIQHELWCSRFLLHDNILVHQNSFIKKQNLNIIYNYMQFGSCVDIIESHFKCGLPEKAIAFILKEVLHGLTYLHKLGFVHRGLKASHILMSLEGKVKICGHRNMISSIDAFGRFTKLYDYPTHDTSYLPWVSPEILQQNMHGYDAKSDIYSFGITACELANGYAPFTDMPVTKMLLEKLRGLMPCLLDRTTLFEENVDNCDSYLSSNQLDNCSTHSTKQFSASFHDMVSGCLQHQPINRPSASELLNHKFFMQASDFNVLEDLSPLVPFDLSFLKIESNTNEPQTVSLSTSCQSHVSWDFDDAIDHDVLQA